MSLRYGTVEDAWTGFGSYLEELASRPGVRRICEIGGGANPALSLDFVRRRDIEYVVLDISSEELAKAPKQYKKVQSDIASPDFDVEGGYDLVFSKMLAEHVRSGRTFHSNVSNLLLKGGIAFHFFPTLYAPPFVINRLLSEQLSEPILLTVQPYRTRQGKYAKFPTYYSWCRGPLRSQVRRFESVGYSVEEYVGFFGHEYYKKIRPLHTVHERISSLLVERPLPWLTSFAYVVLVKQANN